MSDYQQNIDEKLKEYKARYIKKRLLEGLLIFLITAIAIYLGTSSLEALVRFNSWVRAVFFLLFIFTSGFVFLVRVIQPLMQLLKSEAAIDDEKAAQQIGSFFPSLSDKLLNYIQLASSQFKESDLARASLNQRAEEIQQYNFTEAISFNAEKLRFMRVVLPLFMLAALLVLVFPKSIIGSTERIIHFTKTFTPAAPFNYNLSSELIAFRNEDFLLQVKLAGEAIPQEVWFVSNNKRIPMVAAGFGNFELLFPNIATEKNFKFEAASFLSPAYHIKVVDRPALTRFSVNLNYPAYLGLPDETFRNIGSFEVPEGTRVTWYIESKFTKSLDVRFGTDSVTNIMQKPDHFEFSRQIFQNQEYQLNLSNEFGSQQGNILYEIVTIKDEYPVLNVKMLPDTILYKYVVFAGNLSDDHGLSGLTLHYSLNDEKEKIQTIPLAKSNPTEILFYQWLLDSLTLNEGDRLSFYLQLTDNDAVNKFKSTKSNTFYLTIPNHSESMAQLDDSRNNTKEQMKDAADQARELKKSIDKLSDELKGKKELSWQEQQMLQNLVEQKKKLAEEIEKLQEQNRLLNEQIQQFEEPTEELLQKQEQLQDLLDELLDEDTRKLYDELQKMLEEQENTESVQEKLNQLQNKELNLEQELERALEFFKQIQYEQKLDEADRNLDSLMRKQEQLLKETEEKSKSNEELAAEQGKLNKKFEDFEKKMRDARELNQELKRPNSMEETSGEEEEVKNNQESSKENLEKNNRNKSKQSQKSAMQQMKQISKKIDNMQSSMQMQQMQEDLGDLQAILNNLIELSFDQENLMNEFKAIHPNDPRFIQLSQEQLNLRDDSRIINDSLLALSSRVMAIASFVTRELNKMNQHMEESITAIRERKKSEASVSQQLTMTSANNLALMLDNVMQQMQENMARAMGKGQQDSDEQMPGMSELQKKLNEQIRELSQSGKSGRELSEELAKLAAEQERIRKALEEAEEKYGGDQGELERMKKQMEQTEMDLVNKNLTQKTLQRQQQILTRMLEAEKSMRERELDSKREAKTAVQYEKVLPKAFEEYMKQREKEIDLLKTVPPRLVPFFKQEVNGYFDRIKQENKSTNN